MKRRTMVLLTALFALFTSAHLFATITVSNVGDTLACPDDTVAISYTNSGTVDGVDRQYTYYHGAGAVADLIGQTFTDNTSGGTWIWILADIETTAAINYNGVRRITITASNFGLNAAGDAIRPWDELPTITRTTDGGAVIASGHALLYVSNMTLIANGTNDTDNICLDYGHWNSKFEHLRLFNGYIGLQGWNNGTGSTTYRDLIVASNFYGVTINTTGVGALFDSTFFENGAADVKSVGSAIADGVHIYNCFFLGGAGKAFLLEVYNAGATMYVTNNMFTGYTNETEHVLELRLTNSIIADNTFISNGTQYIFKYVTSGDNTKIINNRFYTNNSLAVYIQNIQQKNPILILSNDFVSNRIAVAGFKAADAVIAMNRIMSNYQFGVSFTMADSAGGTNFVIASNSFIHNYTTADSGDGVDAQIELSDCMTNTIVSNHFINIRNGGNTTSAVKLCDATYNTEIDNNVFEGTNGIAIIMFADNSRYVTNTRITRNRFDGGDVITLNGSEHAEVEVTRNAFMQAGDFDQKYLRNSSGPVDLFISNYYAPFDDNGRTYVSVAGYILNGYDGSIAAANTNDDGVFVSWLFSPLAGDMTLPPEPTSPSVSWSGTMGGPVVIEFTEPASIADVATYRVYRATASNITEVPDTYLLTNRTPVSGGASFTHDDYPTSDAKYYYYVTAVDSDGNESWYAGNAAYTFAQAAYSPPLAVETGVLSASNAIVVTFGKDVSEADISGATFTVDQSANAYTVSAQAHTNFAADPRVVELTLNQDLTGDDLTNGASLRVVASGITGLGSDPMDRVTVDSDCTVSTLASAEALSSTTARITFDEALTPSSIMDYTNVGDGTNEAGSPVRTTYYDSTTNTLLGYASIVSNEDDTNYVVVFDTAFADVTGAVSYVVKVTTVIDAASAYRPNDMRNRVVEAYARVTPDITGPALTNVVTNGTSATEFIAMFNENVQAASANTAGNYTVTADGGGFSVTASVTAANRAGATGDNAVLVTLDANPDPSGLTNLRLTVTGVADANGNACAGTYATFLAKDTLAPSVTNLVYYNTTNVVLYFNDDVSDAAGTFAFTNNGGGAEFTPAIVRTRVDASVLDLYFASGDAFTPMVNYDTGIFGVNDTDGNTMAATYFETFQAVDQTPPAILALDASNATEVYLTYDEAVSNDAGLYGACTIANYAITGGASITAINSVSASVYKLTVSGLSADEVSYTLTITNVSDIANTPNVIPESGVSDAFLSIDDTAPMVLSVVSSTTNAIDIYFTETLNESAAENLANYVLSNATTTVAMTSATLTNGTNVRIATTLSQGVEYNITVSSVTDNTTLSPDANNVLAMTNFTFTSLDETPPTVTSVVALSSTSIRVVYSEKVDPATRAMLANYSISNTLTGTTITPTGTITFAGDELTGTLTVPALDDDEVAYALFVQNVKDQASPKNTIVTTNVAFMSLDTTPPTVADVTTEDAYTVLVTFSENMGASALTLANYTNANGSWGPLAPTNAEFGDASNVVAISFTTALVHEATYTLGVYGGADDASTANALVATNVSYEAYIDTPPVISNFAILSSTLDTMNRTVDVTMDVFDADADTMSLSFAYSNSRSNEWTSVAGADLLTTTGGTFVTNVANGAHTMTWQLPLFERGALYTFRMEVRTATGTNVIASNISVPIVTKMFYPSDDIADIKTLNNPYTKDSTGGIVLAGLPDEALTIGVYTAAGVKIADVAYTPDGRGMATWTPGDIAPGVYIVVIQTPLGPVMRKVVIAR